MVNDEGPGYMVEEHTKSQIGGAFLATVISITQPTATKFMNVVHGLTH